MMPLAEELSLELVLTEVEAFDFLNGVRELIQKAMEFHADAGQDGEYCFLFWVDPADEHIFVTRVRSNIEELDRDGYPGWNFDVNWNGTGLVFVRSFL